MSRFKFLAMSVVFAITYIACDLCFIFHCADNTETNTNAPANNTSYEQSYNTQQYNYAYNSHTNIINKQMNSNKAAIIVE